MFISVILPIRNEAAFILDTLAELAAQDYPAEQFEVIVVDGGSDDGTVAKVARFIEDRPNFRLLHNPKRLSSAARNIGIRAAQGDAVVIVDGHCRIQNRQFLANVTEAFLESGADVLGRPQPLEMAGATLLQRAVVAVRNSRLGHHPESFVYSNQPQFVPAKSVGVAYRREVFRLVGCFDESFDAHEDGEFNYRCDMAGLTCWFTPKIAVSYYPRNTLRGLFHQMARYGQGRVRLLRKYPETFGPGTFLPLVFLLGLTLGLPLSLLHPVLITAYLGIVSMYLLVTMSVGVTSVLATGEPAVAVYVPLVSLALHTGAGYGTLVELLRGKKSIKPYQPQLRGFINPVRKKTDANISSKPFKLSKPFKWLNKSSENRRIAP